MTSEPPKVRVGVAAFVLESKSSREGPRFLIGKRLGSHGAGKWALPGGHIEFGETPEDTTIRELEEETGLKVINVRFLTATNDFMPADNKHYITLFMVCERENQRDKPEILEPNKCEGWEWAGWENLLEWVAQEDNPLKGGLVEKKLFLPLLNLARQRPGVKPTDV